MLGYAYGSSTSVCMCQPDKHELYLDCLYIEAADSIECATGPYLLTIGNHQEFGELEDLERKLYEFARSEGYCE